LIETLASGRYRIERELGHGGMATVYLARDEELGRPVAVKLLPEHVADNEDFRARFSREASLAGRLAHPNIVRVYDAGDADRRPFIVMEYVPGVSLADAGRLPVARVVELGVQACAGLQHAHDAGLVHRDVKPANLILREDGVLKIADFGIARAAESTRHTQAGTLLGTAAYLAPEQIAGEDATAASDVYSLGAVLYELLTGRPPYSFTSLGELAAKQADGLIEPVSDLEPAVPQEVEAAVMHALARDPRFRPASAGELGEELSSGTGDQQPTRPLPRRRKVSVPARGGALWLAGAVVVAAIAVALGLARLGDADDDSKSSPPASARVTPPAPAPTAEQQARNLARWLRVHSR
jgi:eukaryotic-like serine/threonine-protein kinase